VAVRTCQLAPAVCERDRLLCHLPPRLCELRQQLVGPAGWGGGGCLCSGGWYLRCLNHPE